MAIASSTTSMIFCRETRTISSSTSTRRSSGFWARPTHALRLNFDLEHTNYDNVIVRMAPRKESRYRFQTDLQPAPVGGFGRIDQYSAGWQCRLTDELRRTQPELRTHRLAYTARGLQARFRLQLQRRHPECPDLLQRYAAHRCDPSLRAPTLVPARRTMPPILCWAIRSTPTTPSLEWPPSDSSSTSAPRSMLGGSFTNVDGSVPQFNILQPLGLRAVQVLTSPSSI